MAVTALGLGLAVVPVLADSGTGSRKPETSGVMVGVEADVLPYLTGGQYASIWVGYNQFRGRVVFSTVNVPEFVTPSSFEEYRIRANAVIIDYFPNGVASGGPWIGAGVEWWDNTIVHSKTGTKGSFSQDVFTVGGGYIYQLSDHLYLNPWLAGHIRINGPDSVLIGAEELELPWIQFEASVKLGWKF